MATIPGHELVGTRSVRAPQARPAGAERGEADRASGGDEGSAWAKPLGLVGALPTADMIALWSPVASSIVKHGFVIEYRDLEPPRTGIFDGLRIVIDPDVGFEMQCFLLLHLFGHSVQWVAPSIEYKLRDLQHTEDKGRFMQVLHDYEFEAAGFGMQLLHDAGVTHLDEWYSDFVETDWRYVERYYATDQIPDWRTCVVNGSPLLDPRPIPPLVHKQVEVRFAF
jgi:hypothetical protein